MIREFAAKHYKFLFIALAFLIFTFIVPLSEEIGTLRITGNFSDNLILVPGEFVSNFVAGGFKGIAADILWLQMDEYWHRGEWPRMLPILRMITWLQPNFMEAWEVGAWHLAYNFYAYTKDEKLKKMFVQEGIRFLQEGIVKNKNKYDLYFNLAWIYYNKLQDYDEAIRYFRMAVFFKHPSYIDRLIAHAYRKKKDYKNEIIEWKKCLNIFKEDAYHQDLSKKFLKEAEEKLKNSK